MAEQLNATTVTAQANRTGKQIMNLKRAELIDVDYGYCDECDNYEIVNTYQMPVICCDICKDKRGREVKSICGSCLSVVLTNGSK